MTTPRRIDATFSAIVTYDANGDNKADNVIVLRDVVKKPVTTNSDPEKQVYQSNYVAASNFKIYQCDAGNTAISSSALKALFKEANTFATECSDLTGIVGALNDKYEA